MNGNLSTNNANSLDDSADNYDYTLKFLLIGDNDVGKDEIFEFIDRSMVVSDLLMNPKQANRTTQSNTFSIQTLKENELFRSIIINCDGCKIRLLMWSTSGQGRFNTILRSFSRGAQGIVLIYDITNKWSFNSIEKWYEELERSLPGIPKILIGNRLHLAFKRQVSENEAKQFAEKRQLIYYEISPLCDYNVLECLIELTRLSLKKIRLFEINGAYSSTNKVLSLQELCIKNLIKSTTYYGIDRLPLPNKLKKQIKFYINSHKYETTSSIMHLTNEKYLSLNNNQFITSPSSSTNTATTTPQSTTSLKSKHQRNSLTNKNSNSNNSNVNSPNNASLHNLNNMKLNYKTKKNSSNSIINSCTAINSSNSSSRAYFRKNCTLM